MADALEFNRRCRFCKAEGLRWSDEDPKKRWKLVDKAGNVHSCNSVYKQNYYKARRTYITMRDFAEKSEDLRRLDEAMRLARLGKRMKAQGSEQEEDSVFCYEDDEEPVFSAGSKVN